jgi:alanine racemase
VLKSNAYGHGILQIAKILDEREFGYFVVDSYYEALKIWQVSNKNVLLIGSMDPLNLKNLNFDRLTITIQDLASLKELIRLKKEVRIHLKVNTGMNRQGFDIKDLDEVVKLIKNNKNIEVEGVLSHLADADNDNDEWTNKQIKVFEKVIELLENLGLKPKYYHLAATAGMVKVKNKKINAARVGLGLYDGALRLKSKIIKIREIKKGDRVSYNGIFKADKKMRIGTIPVGYYEGLDRRLSNKWRVRVGDKYRQILGRICMNLSVIEVRKESQEFDEVEVIGLGENSIIEMAKQLETLPYEVLVGLSESIRRVVVDTALHK